MKIDFHLRFHTKYKETLWISGNITGSERGEGRLPMEWLSGEYWKASVDIDPAGISGIHYRYILQNADGELIPEWENDRAIDLSKTKAGHISTIDTWNHAGEYENIFLTAAFRKTLLRKHASTAKPKLPKKFTHVFKVKAPLLRKNETLCLLGSSPGLGEWSAEKPILMRRQGDWYTIRIDPGSQSTAIAYKYGVYGLKQKTFLRYEEGNNRMLPAAHGELTIIHDGFARLPNNTWKGAGIAIPLFSLRTRKSFGVGEFSDLPMLVDWAKAMGMRLIQLLPINDTTATHSCSDSYPYAAISAFALHPLYVNLEKVAGKKLGGTVKALKKKQKQLNALPEVAYVEIMKIKLAVLGELYEAKGKDFFHDEDYISFFDTNRHWLVPYAAFCYLRDKNGSSDYSRWEQYATYKAEEIDQLCSPRSRTHHGIAFHYFVQYHLHRQLKEAADYAHKQGVVLKGDIPIGIYRYGCDAWMAPELYNMDQQAGAPPDDFAIKGQNWGFPTYNWKRMQEDGFSWWRLRFEQMANYFDAFRVDHILGFFRIWSIPMHAVEGVLGRFVPAMPVRMTEFTANEILFDEDRFCRPFINDQLLADLFGPATEAVKKQFLTLLKTSGYAIKKQFSTQRQIEDHFSELDATAGNLRLKEGLFNLVANVILLKDEKEKDTYHFRIGIENTHSFKHLDIGLQSKLRDLYIDYFYRRQDGFWRKEAMEKLPYLKQSTNMLVCGEDLGMVPHSVPEVMKDLGILSLEIQRMPKLAGKEFFHPEEAPYLSVITPSTHDMSTIRGWWEEDKGKTQRFYNAILGRQGEAPASCEPAISQAIILQHLYSPAMWSIFLVQDILGMEQELRSEDPAQERINIPADPRHFWKYRMHVSIEALLKQKAFNHELRKHVINSGRKFEAQ